MRDFYRDGQKALLAIVVGSVGPFVLLGVVVALAYCAGGRMAKTEARVTAAKDTVHITEHVRDVVAETVRVRLAAKLRMDTIVQVITDTQVVIQRERPETVTVQPEIVERIASCDVFASSCRLQLAADSDVILALHHQIDVTPKPSKCSRKCGFVAGVVAGLLAHGRR